MSQEEAISEDFGDYERGFGKHLLDCDGGLLGGEAAGAVKRGTLYFPIIRFSRGGKELMSPREVTNVRSNSLPPLPIASSRDFDTEGGDVDHRRASSPSSCPCSSFSLHTSRTPSSSARPTCPRSTTVGVGAPDDLPPPISEYSSPKIPGEGVFIIAAAAEVVGVVEEKPGDLVGILSWAVAGGVGSDCISQEAGVLVWREAGGVIVGVKHCFC